MKAGVVEVPCPPHVGSTAARGAQLLVLSRLLLSLVEQLSG